MSRETPLVLGGAVTAFKEKLEFMLAAINKLISFRALKKDASIQIAMAERRHVLYHTLHVLVMLTPDFF